MSSGAAQVLDRIARSAPVLVYALGSGCGHLTRALNLLRLLDAPGVVLHSEGAWSPVDPPEEVRLVPVGHGAVAAEAPRLMKELARAAGALVVDTFPGGAAHELADETIAPFALRALVRRYLRPGTYEDEEALAARFDLQLLPYEEALCEWEGAVPGFHLGPLVRRLQVASGAPWDLAIVGEPGRLPSGWRAALPERTTGVSGPFHALPRARAYFGSGAGHNLTYELLSTGVPFRVLPEERSHDDQFRRADRLGVGVYSRDELRAFLRGGADVARP